MLWRRRPFPQTASSLDSHLERRRQREVIKTEECLEPSLLVLPFIAVTQGVYRMVGGGKTKTRKKIQPRKIYFQTSEGNIFKYLTRSARRGIGSTQSSGSIGLGDLFSVFNIRFQMFITFYSKLQSGSLARSIITPEKQETIFGSSVSTSWFPNRLEVESPLAG